MPYIAKQPLQANGKFYNPGEVVPDVDKSVNFDALMSCKYIQFTEVDPEAAAKAEAEAKLKADQETADKAKAEADAKAKADAKAAKDADGEK